MMGSDHLLVSPQSVKERRPNRSAAGQLNHTGMVRLPTISVPPKIALHRCTKAMAAQAKIEIAVKGLIRTPHAFNRAAPTLPGKETRAGTGTVSHTHSMPGPRCHASVNTTEIGDCRVASGSGKCLDWLLLRGSGRWHLDRVLDDVERDDGDFFMQWIGFAAEVEDPQVIEAKIL